MNTPLTLMAVHAHPDDESSSTGGVLARYSAEGVRTVVVTCTNGELGDAPGGIKPGEDGHDEESVARIRLAELDQACALLGVTAHETLGYQDSGMVDWEYKDRPRAFCNVSTDEVADRLSKLFELYRPQVIITYDDASGYDHPDHRKATEVTLAALDRGPAAEKLYFTAMLRRNWEVVRTALEEAGRELPPMPAPSKQMLARIAATEARITTTIDLGASVEQKRQALAAHSSQLDESFFMQIPDAVFAQAFGQESFIRVRDNTGAPIPESDLLAGLR